MDFTFHPDKEHETTDDEIYTAFNEVFAAIKDTASIDLTNG